MKLVALFAYARIVPSGGNAMKKNLFRTVASVVLSMVLCASALTGCETEGTAGASGDGGSGAPRRG